MKLISETAGTKPESSAGVSPAVPGASRPRFGEVTTFWQREYYDHLIQGEEEFERAVRYVAENPAKANLTHWKWVWVRGRDARATAAGDGGATKTA